MKTVLMTGATSGIGFATAQQFARSGANLVLVGRRQDRLEDIQKRFQSSYPQQQFHAVQLDLQKIEDIKRFSNSPLLKNVDVLINNAGLAKGTSKFQEADIADWEQMIDTNIKGLLYLTRFVIPHMIAKKSGHVVNLGSVAGRWVYQGGSVYCASKFAVRALSEGLRMDLMGTDIRVSNIEPGMVQTEFSLVRLGDQAKADQVYAGMKPLTADDIAETILWVVNRPAHINIQELVIFPTDQAAVGMVHRS